MSSFQVLPTGGLINASVYEFKTRFVEIRFEKSVFRSNYIIAQKESDSIELTQLFGNNKEEYLSIAEKIFTVDERIKKITFQSETVKLEFTKINPTKTELRSIGISIQKLVIDWYTK